MDPLYPREPILIRARPITTLCQQESVRPIGRHVSIACFIRANDEDTVLYSWLPLSARQRRRLRSQTDQARCPFWVIFVRSTRSRFSACPLRSDRVRTFAPQRIDALCQNRPLAASLNNLVYECEQICRHIETECLGGLEIDGQF